MELLADVMGVDVSWAVRGYGFAGELKGGKTVGDLIEQME